MIKQLLNSAIEKYRDLSVARRSIICLCLRHRQIIDLLATDKSRYFAQSRPIIVYYFFICARLELFFYFLQFDWLHERAAFYDILARGPKELFF